MDIDIGVESILVSPNIQLTSDLYSIVDRFHHADFRFPVLRPTSKLVETWRFLLYKSTITSNNFRKLHIQNSAVIAFIVGQIDWRWIPGNFIWYLQYPSNRYLKTKQNSTTSDLPRFSQSNLRRSRDFCQVKEEVLVASSWVRDEALNMINHLINAWIGLVLLFITLTHFKQLHVHNNTLFSSAIRLKNRSLPMR
jgi:hypothetical protein